MKSDILCVDDDPNVLAGFQRSLRKQFSLDTASSGRDALRLISEQGPYAVIVADMRMPEMDGVQLLAEVKTQAPDTVRIMLTGNSDQQTAIDAVNRGRIFRFLTKPCSPEAMAGALREGLAQHRMLLAERDLLEQTLNGSVALLTDVLALVEPVSFGRGQELRATTRAFAAILGATCRWEMEMGAMLAQLGRVTLPPQLLLKMRSGLRLTPEERDLELRIPELGFNLLVRIPRLEPVAQIVRYQAKHYDGSGLPDDLVAGDEIPIGSRILKVINDLNQLQSAGVEKFEALQKMSLRKGWYDPKVLAAAYKCFHVPMPEEGTQTYTLVWAALRDIHPLQILVDDVLTHDGVLIVKANTTVTPPLLERLRNFRAISGLKEPILVRVPR